MSSDDAAGPPVLATSVNPAGRLADQLAAVRAWQALGVEVLSFNGAEESLCLAPHLPEAARVVLPEADTARLVLGRGMPRVLPVLERLAAFGNRPLILANADIVPAADASVVSFWLAQAPALALTREDCDLVPAHEPAERAPYRNGLDVFLFSPAGLAATLRVLARFPVRHRMAFGVPGWDFLLGAVVRSAAVGGRIMDGAVLLHERHAQTYATIDEFAHYVGAMQALGEAGTAADGDEATAEAAAFRFHRRIVADCEAEAPLADLAHSLHYRRPPPLDPSPRARDVAAFLLRFGLAGVDAFALTQLAERQLRGGVDGERIRTVLASGLPPSAAFAAELAATLLALAVLSDGRPVPVTAGRADAAERRAASAEADPAVRRRRLARLHGDTLGRRLFDAELHDALALWCGNDEERRLLAAMLAVLDRAPAPAPAPEPPVAADRLPAP